MDFESEPRRKLPLTPAQEEFAKKMSADLRLSSGLMAEKIHAVLPPRPQFDHTQNADEFENVAEISDEEVVRVMKVSLRWTEDVWTAVFERRERIYAAPKLVLFTDAIMSGCGMILSSRGPAYCPADKKIYFDPSFHAKAKHNMWRKWDATSTAYVIFHEVSHSIQDQLGLLDHKAQLLQTMHPHYSNHIERAFEKQADYLAGWAFQKAQEEKNILEQFDLQKMYWSSASVGDDLAQYRFQHELNALHHTHGTAKERSGAFLLGYRLADLEFGLNINNFLSHEIAQDAA